MRVIAIASLLALFACTTPAVHVEPVPVKVPVAVPCIDRMKVPSEPSPTGTLDRDARKTADVLAAKVLELRGYGRELIALIQPCTVPLAP